MLQKTIIFPKPARCIFYTSHFELCLISWQALKSWMRWEEGLACQLRREIFALQEKHEGQGNGRQRENGYPEGAPSLLSSTYLAVQGGHNMVVGATKRPGLTPTEALQASSLLHRWESRMAIVYFKFSLLCLTQLYKHLSGIVLWTPSMNSDAQEAILKVSKGEGIFIAK